MSSSDEEYGPARLIEHFVQPESCVDSLIAEVQKFGIGSQHTDDATALLIRSR
jgi:phosphoserine phosphatase RsbU/P